MRWFSKTFFLLFTFVIVIFFNITALIKDLFLGRIQYSENGTTNKIKEVDTYIQFGDYLEECKGNIQVIKRVKDMFYVINIHISRWWRGSLRRCVKFFFVELQKYPLWGLIQLLLYHLVTAQSTQLLQHVHYTSLCLQSIIQIIPCLKRRWHKPSHAMEDLECYNWPHCALLYLLLFLFSPTSNFIRDYFYANNWFFNLFHNHDFFDHCTKWNC